MTIRGLDPRFILGTYYNQSQRTTWELPSSEKVEFIVKDQYSEKYLRKLGNRYTNKFQIFDFTETEKNTLLAMNGTTQSFYQHYDTVISGVIPYRTVYCDIYFNELKYYPKSVIEVTLTDRDVIDEATNSYVASGLVNWDGYVSSDGINDYAEIPLTTLGNTFSIGFTYRNWTVTSSDWILFGNNGGEIFRIQCDYGTSKHLTIRSGTSSAQRAFTSDLPISSGSSSWHDVIICINVSTQTCTMYFDGIEDAGVASLGLPFIATSFTSLKMFFGSTGAATLDFKQCKIWNKVLSAAEALAYHNGTFDAVDQLAWYKCDEQSGNLIDYSGNGNDAVVYNASSSFYNGDYIYKWYIQENIQYDTPYPKFVMGAHTYIFDSLECKVTEPIEFSISNVIDWQDTSITGRLHRDYALDADGNIKQEIKYVIRKDNLERADYDLLKIYDGKTIQYYPNNDEAEYYDADVSMEFLNLNNMIFCDYVEIEILIRGVRQT